MPENAGTVAPGTAGQAAAPAQGTTAGAAQGTGSAPAEQAEPSWVKDVRSSVESMKAENKRSWDNIRSTTDKHLADMRRQIQARRTERAQDDGDGYSFDDATDNGQRTDRREAPQKRERSPREDTRESRRALSDYRMNYADGSEYHDEVLAIANDSSRGGRFAVRDEDGNVDYYASLEAIHQQVELEALRKLKVERDKDRQERNDQRREQRRDATISGGGSSAGEAPNLDDMTEEQLLAEMKNQGMENPTDPSRKR